MNARVHHLQLKPQSHCAVIVAHPDDETLWAGGTMLSHPEVQWTIVTLCRARDPDRAPRFYQACELYGAEGRMADMDDGPEQSPLPDDEVQETLLHLLPSQRYDLILTHGLRGEYTRHLRHEEVSAAVMALCGTRRLHARQILHFAYSDGHGEHLPRPETDADIEIALSDAIWRKKHRIMTETYGFAPDSWEARTTPKQEHYWEFSSHSTT